ncbi:hypothetical protein ILYODFUR_037370 [Ilyodon furcidens]|uniref:Uncharacterized protein n=1 Tax=Ilyodon furcidens TaxID=33524 RepID=A0ABV0TGU5_9TELE
MYLTGPGRPTAPGRAQPASSPSASTRRAPPPHPRHHNLVQGRGPEPQKDTSNEGHHIKPKTGHCANPTPNPRGAQQASRTHSLMAFPAAPSRGGSPSTKAKPNPSHHRTLSSQDPPTGTPCPASQRTGHRSQGSRSKIIQTVPREPKQQPWH